MLINNPKFVAHTQGRLIDTVLRPITAYFIVNGQHATRKQFPLQNCFTLTVHKAQGITLPKISTFLDSQFFASDQAYVALSRAQCWNNVQIPCLSRDAFNHLYKNMHKKQHHMNLHKPINILILFRNNSMTQT